MVLRRRALRLAVLLPLLGGCRPRPSAAATNAPETLRYVVPPCPVTYEVDTVETTQMDGFDRTPASLHSFLEVQGHPEGTRWVLTASMTSSSPQGKYRSFTLPNTQLAPVHLETDGLRWNEVDGSTMLFRSLGTSTGLSLLLPELPPSTAAGSTVEGLLRYPSTKDVYATEAARGSNPQLAAAAKGPLPGGPPIAPLPMHMRLERWEDVAGSPAAVLTMNATQSVSDSSGDADIGGSPFALSMSGEMTYRATYVVLASGMLLRATVDKDAQLDLRTTVGGTARTDHHVQHMHTEARLTKACGGPTEPPLAVPLGREEKAIASWGATAMAIAGGERDKALAGFAPQVRHGRDDKLWSALVAYVAARGAQAVPAPLFVKDADVTSDATQVNLVVEATTADGLQANTNVPLACKISLNERAGLFEATELRCDLGLQQGTLLDISASRMIMVTGWPWPPR